MPFEQSASLPDFLGAKQPYVVYSFWFLPGHKRENLQNFFTLDSPIFAVILLDPFPVRPICSGPADTEANYVVVWLWGVNPRNSGGLKKKSFGCR